jgi:hypothetical protein
VEVLCDDVKVVTVRQLGGISQEEEMEREQDGKAGMAEVPASGEGR